MDRFSFPAFIICAGYQRKKGKYYFHFAGGHTGILSNAGWIFTDSSTWRSVQYFFIYSFFSDKGSNRNGRCVCGFAVCMLSALLFLISHFCSGTFYGRCCGGVSYFDTKRKQKDGNTVSAVSYVFLFDLSTIQFLKDEETQCILAFDIDIIINYR